LLGVKTRAGDGGGGGGGGGVLSHLGVTTKFDPPSPPPPPAGKPFLGSSSARGRHKVMEKVARARIVLKSLGNLTELERKFYTIDGIGTLKRPKT
jgi:hypothetical protein